jgi:hypothetical protein
VEEGGEPKRNYKIPTHLVVRESTGYPRGTMLHLGKRGGKAKSAPMVAGIEARTREES